MVDRLNKPNKGVQDWHTPVNENFEEVEEASYVERTVADFEGGTLPDAFDGVTSAFSVQSSVVDSGQYALLADCPGNAIKINSTNGLTNYPQAGDKFYTSFYISNANDLVAIRFGKQSSETYQDVYRLLLVSGGNSSLSVFNGGSNTELDSKSSVLSNHVNEWIDVEVEWGLDGEINISLIDSTGSKIQSFTGNDDSIKSGGIGLYANTDGANTEVYFDSWTLERRETEARTNTQKGTTQLGNEVVPSGSIQTGPTTSSTNAKRAIYQDAPVDNTATAGTQSKLTLLQSGLNPAMFMERTLDGQGGAFGHKLQTPTGRIPNINNRLDFNYENKSDVQFSLTSISNDSLSEFGVLDGTTSLFDVNAADGTTISPETRPRELGFSYDATTNSAGKIRQRLSCPIPVGELGAVRVTLHGVRTNSDGSGGENAVAFKLVGNNGEDSMRYENKYGNVMPKGPQPQFLDANVVAIEADYINNEYRYINSQDGVNKIISRNVPNSLKIGFMGVDDYHTDEFVEMRIKEITVEPLPEVLQ